MPTPRKTRRLPVASSHRARCRPQFETLENRSLLTAGMLDPTFGSGGLVVTDLGSTFEHAYDTVIQQDDKIVTAGDTVRSGTGQDFALVRYNSNGTLDTSFGTSGRAITDLKGSGDVALAVAQQADGKIVAAGYANNSRSGLDFALTRYNSNGTLDTSFGSKGKVVTTISRDNDVITAMAIQSDGRIVVAGWTEQFGSAGTGNFVAARYNANGSLDSTFGSGGKVVTDFAGSQDHAEGLALQSDGKIVVAGRVSLPSLGNSGYGLARYNPNGSLDNTFGTQGKVTTIIGDAGAWAKDVAIQADGQIVAAGYYEYHFSPTDDYRGVAVARYQTNGSLDPTFGASGVATITEQPYLDAESLVIQPNGKIVVAGSSPGPDYFFLARLNGPDGSLDTTFGTSGLVRTDFGPTFGVPDSNDIANSVAIQADGRIVAAGSFANPSTNNVDVALARYEGDAPLQAAFAAPNPTASVLADSLLQPLLTEAVSRWHAAGADVSSLGMLQIRVADLGGNYLGMTDSQTIWLDDNAAGWGWFVDTTPKSDSEFATSGNQGEQDHIDLLTAIMHELGHVLEHAHDADGVMAETLATGVRRTELEGDHAETIDQIFAQPDDGPSAPWLEIWLNEHSDSTRALAKRHR